MPQLVNQYITQIVGENQFNTAFQEFAGVCATNAAALGLSPDEVADIQLEANKVTTKLGEWVAAKSAAAAAKSSKDTQFEAGHAYVAQWAKTFRANILISDDLLADLKLPPHNPPKTTVPPAEVDGVVAKGNGQGYIKLSWNRAGNKSGTVFVIEYRTSVGSPWQVLDATTRARFGFQWQVGDYIGIRVSARRGNVSSQPSAPVVLWEAGGDNVVMLQAA
jgi:hypothetical protein